MEFLSLPLPLTCVTPSSLTASRAQSLATLLLIITLLPFTATSLPAADLVFKNNGTKAATLVELYSSEGCSSCPPAEAWISTLKTAPGLWRDLFPVAFHVDYWDNLGWPDRFARPAYTQRQRDYAAQLQQESVYTPEFVVNGREWRGWFHGEPLPPAPAVMRGELILRTDDHAGNASVTYSLASSANDPSCTINVALLGLNLTSDVRGGENGGRRLQHDFIVLDFISKPLTPDSSGRLQSGPLALAASKGDSPGAIVAWISTADHTIIQIAGGYLKAPVPSASP